MATQSAITFARFWSKVDIRKSADCWFWRASLDRYGYGQFKGASGETPKRAHRVAYEHIIGPIAAGLVLRHRCNNPSCCNPKHMEPGTQADNHDDREEAGRCPRQRGRFALVGAASED